MEHSTNGLNSKHEEASLVHIKRAYKFSALTLLFQIRLNEHMGQGRRMIDWNGKSGD
jgi:hypothetical protein